MLLADYSKFVLLPEDKFAGHTPPPQSIPKSLGHHQEFIHACKTGAPTTCNFAYSGLLTEANHLGNIAYRVGKKILWDHQGMRITNAPDAERFISDLFWFRFWREIVRDALDPSQEKAR